jgi:opacity protein-like surface antigen
MKLVFVSLMMLSSMAFTVHSSPQWNHFYGGVNVGGVFNHAKLDANHPALVNPDGTCNSSSHFNSFFPGVQAGYLHQFESGWLLGAEGDFTYNVSQSSQMNCDCPGSSDIYDQFKFSNRLQGSIRGRMGYLLDSGIFPFISAGGSFADLKVSYDNEAGETYSNSASQQPGWLLGGGIEWRYLSNWSIRAEYYYIDYNRLEMNMPSIYTLLDSQGRAQFNVTNNNVRLAINHWF